MPIATEIKVPKLGLTMTEATIGEWRVAAGGRFSRGAAVVVIETDKTANDIEAPSDGILLEVLAQPGTVVPVGETIGRWSVETDAPDADDHASNALAKPESAARLDRDTASSTAPVTALRAPGCEAPSRLIATPRARHLARQADIDLRSVSGTGPGRRVTAKDVISADGSRPSEDAPQALHRSLVTLHRPDSVTVRLSRSVDVTKVQRACARFARDSADHCSLLAFIIFAAARALRDSADLEPKECTDTRSGAGRVDVGFADRYGVEINGILKDCDHLTLREIMHAMDTYRDAKAPSPAECDGIRLVVCDLAEDGTDCDTSFLPLNGALLIRASAPGHASELDVPGHPVSSLRLTLCANTAVGAPAALNGLLRRLTSDLTEPMRLLL